MRSLWKDTPYLPGTRKVRLVKKEPSLAAYEPREKDSETSGAEPERKSSVGAEAIGSEANVDLTGVGEEGRRGRLSPTK